MDEVATASTEAGGAAELAEHMTEMLSGSERRAYEALVDAERCLNWSPRLPDEIQPSELVRSLRAAMETCKAVPGAGRTATRFLAQASAGLPGDFTPALLRRLAELAPDSLLVKAVGAALDDSVSSSPSTRPSSEAESSIQSFSMNQGMGAAALNRTESNQSPAALGFSASSFPSSPDNIWSSSTAMELTTPGISAELEKFSATLNPPDANKASGSNASAQSTNEEDLSDLYPLDASGQSVAPTGSPQPPTLTPVTGDSETPPPTDEDVLSMDFHAQSASQVAHRPLLAESSKAAAESSVPAEYRC